MRIRSPSFWKAPQHYPLCADRASELGGEFGVDDPPMELGLDTTARAKVLTDDLDASNLVQIGAHGFGNARCKPIRVGGVGNVDEVQHEHTLPRLLLALQRAKPQFSNRRLSRLDYRSLERRGKLTGGRESVCGVLGERLRNGGGHSTGERRAHADQRRRGAYNVLADDGQRTRTAEGWTARQHLVTYAAQAVHIAAPIEVPFGGRLLGAHIRWCADCNTD